MKLQNIEVDKSSLIVDGVDTKDFPDFCDAYFYEGQFVTGENLSDDQLQELGELYPEELHELAMSKYF